MAIEVKKKKINSINEFKKAMVGVEIEKFTQNQIMLHELVLGLINNEYTEEDFNNIFET